MFALRQYLFSGTHMLGSSSGTRVLSSPLNLSGLDLWYDASDIATLFQDNAGSTPVTANNDVVGKMNDKSGNGRHVTQATVSKKPLYKTGIQGGLPAVQFDATDDYMSGTAFDPALSWTLFILFGTLNAKQGFTGPIACVGANQGFKIVSSSSTTLYFRRMALYSGGAEEANTYGNTATSLALPFTPQLFTWRRVSATPPSLRQNKQDVAVVSQSNSFGTLNLLQLNIYTGTAAAFGMNLCELLLYNSALSSYDINRVESYLNRKWGIY